MQKEIAKRWADDKYGYVVRDCKLIHWSSLPEIEKRKNRREWKIFYEYLKRFFDRECRITGELEKIKRFKNGDETYKNFK